MEIDYSKIEFYDSGKIMKSFIDYVNKKLKALFPDFSIKLIPEGVPYMMSMVQWEVLLTDSKCIWFWENEEKYMQLRFLMYPAGFRVRPHDVIPYKEEIVLSIQKTIVNLLEKHGGN